MEYYYLGLEARVRDNKFTTIEEAKFKAQESADYFICPVRVFKMDDDRKSVLVAEMQPTKTLKV